MSIEPLSWDVSGVIANQMPLTWAVIGAATSGPTVFQPNAEHVAKLLTVLDQQRVPVFFKGQSCSRPVARVFPKS